MEVFKFLLLYATTFLTTAPTFFVFFRLTASSPISGSSALAILTAESERAMQLFENHFSFLKSKQAHEKRVPRRKVGNETKAISSQPERQLAAWEERLHDTLARSSVCSRRAAYK